ncbi:DUF3618 domain-containing protein [Actinophytocola oryzae]|uniref:Uncharacterized protein DUF3618 n=1 Tax=Actinophytocola oryzae TaxID=502181 RepID=A0A4R7W6E8_9PSEU|nr:DUF3618 domain-containing protein [Actinophytocola oryzae]TDV57247.1 uncharacterized protein DUF3618 [Actinophytocola oryzae]
MTDRTEKDRLTMPGQPPTDEDLRTDVELTRQELAQTVSALSDKADIKARAQGKVAELRTKGDELAEKLPEPVRPVVTTATRKPVITLAALVALLVLLRQLLKRR